MVFDSPGSTGIKLYMEQLIIPPMDQVTGANFMIQGQPWSRDYIRVVSWNIERGLHFSAIHDFLRSAEADLILLQEVDLNVRRTCYRDVATELARLLGVNYVFGKEFEELNAGSNGAPAFHGLATLSPWPLSRGRIIRFQRQSNFWSQRWFIPQKERFQRRFGGRISLIAEAQIYGRQVIAYNLHLESKGKDIVRLEQLRETLEDTRRNPASSLVIVSGDFNLNAGNRDAAASLFSAGLKDALRRPEIPTTVAGSRFQKARSVDWICVSGEVGSEGSVHTSTRASDHFPISVTLALS